MHTYTLGQMETAVTAAHGISEDGLPAFKARLRHLRNLGVPMIPSVGSGKRVDYSEGHVRQLFLALELEQFGLSPKLAARFVRDIWLSVFLIHVKDILEVAETAEDNPWYMVFNPFFIGEAFGKHYKDEIILVDVNPQLCQKKDLISKILPNTQADPKQEQLRDQLHRRIGIPGRDHLQNPRRLMVLNLTDGLSMLKRELIATRTTKRPKS